MSDGQDFGRGWSEYSDRRAGPSDWQPPVGWLQRGNQHRPGDIVRHRSTNDIGTVSHISPDNPEIVHVDWHHDSPGASVFAHGGAYSSDHHWSALEPVESANPMQLSELDHAYLDQISQGDPIGGNDHWIIRSPNKEARTAAVWDWKPYTPTLVQQLQDNDLWDGTGVDQRAWEARSEAGDHYTIRPAGSLFNTLPNDHPLKHTGDPSRWEVDHLPPEYGHDPEGYMGDIYGPTALNRHAEPVEGVHPHGFSSVDEAMDWVKSRHPEESFNPDDRQDPFDPRLIGAALKAARYADSVLRRTARDEDLVLPPDAPHRDWQPKYKNENDPTVRQWHPPFGETHVKYHIYRGGGGRNPIVWSANHHGTYQGLETIDSPTGAGGSITWPLYSNGYEPDQLGRFRTPEQAQAAAEKHFADTYGRHQKMDGLDVDRVMREHGDRPRAGTGLGDDEDYGHIFGMLRQAGWDMADIVRLAGDGMSWEDTMAHIDKVLAEGDNSTPEDDEITKGVPAWYMAHDDDDGPYDDPSRECDACGTVDNKHNMYVTESEQDGSLQWHCDPCAERIYQRKKAEKAGS